MTFFGSETSMDGYWDVRTPVGHIVVVVCSRIHLSGHGMQTMTIRGTRFWKTHRPVTLSIRPGNGRACNVVVNRPRPWSDNSSFSRGISP
jgi:hypothetical protein